MANAARKEDGEGSGISGEYTRPDAKLAVRIYREEVAPKLAHMATIKGDLSDPHKRIKDEAHFPRKVLDFLVTLDDMEDAKRDHWLIALSEGMKELELVVPTDLVSLADGSAGQSPLPSGARARMSLVTTNPPPQPSDGTETDLAGEDADDDDDGDDFDEADESELAAQQTRPSTEAAQAEADAASEAPKRGRKPGVSSVKSAPSPSTTEH
ncbi:hypothetical protein GRI97_08205 [Altererythrobacter xixiisoli]|uniref:Uncharacterized protein n=1 Tax=Croceibacterium xixiisoli TaxID=1476466 RepID=A0A6I4TUM1_9SPHN|nr:hypothetical protein [Croceibacterium xixiisoli]MXO98969.1 hypothetical protein [Croceibacterium xixiisoli]